MPVYDYRCSECGATYDVYHKVREAAEDIRCPSCGSLAHTRLMSAAAVSLSGGSTATGSCATGGSCCGGSCGLN